MEHEMKLKAIYFDLITTGKKIYEIRLNDEKRRQIKVGDTIIFKKEPLLMDTIKAKVENLTYFQSFKEMLDILPLYQIGFQENTKDGREKESQAKKRIGSGRKIDYFILLLFWGLFLLKEL